MALIRIDPHNRKGLDTLKSLLTSPSVEVRRRTIWSLKDIGAEAKPARSLIESSVNDSDVEVIVAASRLLDLIDGR